MSKATENPENVPEEEKKTLTIAEKIQKELDAANALAETAVKKAAELEKLSNIGDDVTAIVDTIASLDKDIGEKKAAFAELIKPYNEKIAEAKKSFDEDTKELVEVRATEYTKIVESVGETGAKMLTGKAVSTGTGKGRGRSGNTREQVVAAVCDDNMSFADAAEKFDHMGKGERDGSQKVGHLVGRHIKLAVGEGTVVDNGDDTYSRV